MAILKQFRIVYLLRQSNHFVGTQKDDVVDATTAEEAVELFKSRTPVGYEHHVQYWEEVKSG